MKNLLLLYFLIQILPFQELFAVSNTEERQVSPDKSLNDSIIKFIKSELNKSELLTSRAYYPEAYDKVWDALVMADSINNATLKYKAYRQLAQLYSIFRDDKMAYSCIDSMFRYAQISGVLDLAKVKSSLNYSAALTYRMNGEYNKAKQHLAVCEEIADSLHMPANKRLYILTEKAHLNTLTGNFDVAGEILQSISKQISDKHAYSSIVYSMWGDLFTQKGEYHKALDYYNKCLKTITTQNSRIGLKVDLLEKISNINRKLGNYRLALEQMTESKLLGDSLFGSQSARNKQLFEIKDTYRKSLAENRRLQKEQELHILKAQKEKLFLRWIFSLILFVITVLAGIIVFRLLKRKLLVEKALMEERTKAELEIKKKELAVTALQLIEKDKLLDEIKQGLQDIKDKKDDASVERIKSTININSAKTWEEFEARFVQVNSTFYESLGLKHPDLSRNELKLCALIKLNFSTKEMAQLLGVSADSANKARYRLRKKLDLQRDDNLVAYINTL